MTFKGRLITNDLEIGGQATGVRTGEGSTEYANSTNSIIKFESTIAEYERFDGNKSPLIVEFKIEDWGKLQYLLAPKLRDIDDN